jgi:SRSO17 transposase
MASAAAQTIESATIEHWSESFAQLFGRIAHRFRRVEVRERARRYLVGLLERVERKNGWQLAEAIGEHGPQGVQRLLNAAVWDADAVRAGCPLGRLRSYVIDSLGDATSGILIVDETGFLKKGTQSCGVGRQYTGTAGDTVNAQVGSFLAYMSRKGAAFIDRALYLPRSWTGDRDRRAVAGVPARVRFATKTTLAKRMLGRAFAAGVPARWVVGDSAYGRSHALRRWLEAHRRPYALMVPKTNAVQYQGRRQTADKLAAQLPETAWTPVSSGMGAQGERVHDWACMPLSERCPTGMRRWLLMRRSPEDPDDLAYYLACGPACTPMDELIRVCDARWQVEECFAQAKGEVGMDQYEVRTWTAWYRFVTLCMVAHALLVVLRAQVMNPEREAKKGIRQVRSCR